MTTPMTDEVILQSVPQEAVDYAFDQFEDRMMDPDLLAETAGNILDNEQVEFSYDTGAVTFHDTIERTVVRHAVYEHLDHMIREVEAGDRDDHTVGELESAKRSVREAFSG